MLRYQQIINYIMNNIDSKHFKPQKPLPTIRDLAAQFDCSKSTVIRAYNELQKKNIVYAVPQSGYFLINKENNKSIDKSLINFTSATPDKTIFPHRDFQNCLAEASNKYKDILFTYNNPQGLCPLRTALSEHLKNYHVYSCSDNLFITSGSQQTIYILCNIEFPNNKSNILIEEPTYTGILKILRWKNIPAFTVKRDFSGIDMEELEKQFKYNDIKFFYTTTRFHNPLGSSLSLTQRRKICQLAEKYDVYIVEDDYLSELQLRSDVPLYYEDMSHHVIYIKSFSKIMLPELRLASVVMPDSLIDRFNCYKDYMDLGTSILLQGALEIYLSSGMFRIHKQKSRKIYRHKMTAIKQISSEYALDGLEYHIPDTGYFFCIKTPDSIDISKLIDNIMQQNILLKSIKDNFLNQENIDSYYKQCLKLCISSLSEKEISMGIRRIMQYITSIAKK